MEDTPTIQFNKDELVPPAFLNHEYFENALKKSENDNDLKLKEYKTVPGTKPGDHFASIMFKVIVTYSSRGKTIENRVLILKTIPVEGNKKDILTESPLFSNEIAIYTKVLPEMERIMRNAGDNEVLGPRIVYHSLEPPVIILDDITKQGFEMVYQNLNFDNLQFVIDKLAKYHALSLIIADEKTQDIYFETALMTEKSKEGFIAVMGGIKYLFDQMKSWPGFEQIHSKMEGSEQRIVDKAVEVFNRSKSEGYNVLNHGDFHIKNMMFKTSGEKVEEVMLLDFQIPYWGSPAIDLAYMIYLIADEDARDRKYEVYASYHSRFCTYLEKYGYLKKPPSLLDLNIEILKGGAEELFLLMCFVPVTLLDFTKVDMTELFDVKADVPKSHTQVLYDNPKLVALYKKLLPQFLYKGHLD